MSMTGETMAAWKIVAARIRDRPVPFLVAAALLAGTDLLQWKAGLLDGTKGADVDGGLVAQFLATKLLATLGWLLASMRLAAGPEARRLLHLSRRQMLWLGSLLLLLPVALGARLLFQKLAGAALAPLSPDPRAVLLAGILLYLAAFLYFQVRLMPALVGVLLGDRQAGLKQAWRGTRGHGIRFIGTLLLAILPLFLIHFGNALLWLPEASAPRLAMLAFDGAIMAALLFTGSAAYVGLYRKARSVQAETEAAAAGALGPA